MNSLINKKTLQINKNSKKRLLLSYYDYLYRKSKSASKDVILPMQTSKFVFL